MGSRSPLAAAPRMLDARRAFRSSVRCWCGSAAMARSSTVLSIDMVSGSYAARLMSAAQNMARCSPVSRRFAKLALNIWSIYRRVHVIHSILVTRRNFARAREAAAPDNAWLVRKTIPRLMVLGGNKPSEVARARRHHPQGRRLRSAARSIPPLHKGPLGKAPTTRPAASCPVAKIANRTLGFEVQRNDAPATACLVRINSNSIRLR